MKMTKLETDKLPPLVKVGAYDYRIELFKAVEATSASRYGDCSHLLNRIRVDMQHGTRQAAKTLLHEIMHAICAGWDRGDDEKEEGTVSKMSLGLAAVWRDNPDVMTWIGFNILHGS